MMPAENNRQIGTWGEALRIQRIKAGLSCHQVGSTVGTDKDTVKGWEAGSRTPTALHLKRLYDLLPKLKYFTAYLPQMMRSQLERRAYASGEEGKELWIPPSPTPADLPVPGDVAQISFGEALRVALRDEDMDPEDIVELVNVSNKMIIHLWESNTASPDPVQYNTLLELLPQLKTAPKPGERDTTAPPVCEPPHGKILALVPMVTDAPSKPQPQFVDARPAMPEGSKPLTHRITIPPPQQPAPTPPPVAKVEPKIAEKAEAKPRVPPMKTKVDIAGVLHANALLALRHAEIYLEDLKTQMAETEKEIIELKKEAQKTEKDLLEAVSSAAERMT